MGEISALTNCQRTTTVTVESPVTALWMSLANLKEILSKSEVLQSRLWKFAAMKITENLLRNKEPYNILRQKEFQRWLKKGELQEFIKQYGIHKKGLEFFFSSYCQTYQRSSSA